MSEQEGGNAWTAATPLRSNADFKALLQTPRPDWQRTPAGGARGGAATASRQAGGAKKEAKPFKPPKPRPKAAQEEDEGEPKYRRARRGSGARGDPGGRGPARGPACGPASCAAACRLRVRRQYKQQPLRSASRRLHACARKVRRPRRHPSVPRPRNLFPSPCAAQGPRQGAPRGRQPRL